MNNVVTPSRAAFGLGVLTLINFLNYTDRYILAGVMKKVQDHFHLTDTDGGLLATTFMVVYLIASPVGGFLGDRLPRHFLIAGAVLVWSLATIASGLASSFVLLIIARAATGVGEAGYGTIAPSFISDLFKPERRSRMLAIFYTAMPLGAAAGFILGGFVGDKHGWQAAFFVGGAPGIVLGLMCFFIPEPQRGGMEAAHVEKIPFMVGLKELFTNGRFWVVTAGLTLMTFSIGGLSNWMPKFLESERGFSGTDAGLYLGATTVVGGLLGTLAGGFLGDRIEKRMPGGGVLMSGFGLSFAAPMMLVAVHAESKSLLLGSLLLAQFFIFLNNGPLNAAIVNVVSPGFRAFAFSISTMTLHLLGDAASPAIIGWISDTSKKAGGPGLATAIQINALPVLIGGLVLLAGARWFRPNEPPRPASA
ncbi:MAG: MFS transporter [Archangium gephyra]|uniref:MFS transporter n=1 Tax=Archangium gephyra TaxID=48 RepID=A0A2W5T7A2_9BACT|nr:MAG: MFS transporter [Archangium gephyra]